MQMDFKQGRRRSPTAGYVSEVDYIRFMKKLFLNDRFILSVILLNCAVLFVEEMGLMHPTILAVDVICILIFTIEMLVKHSEQGMKLYWSNGWNRMDGTLVLVGLVSLPGMLLAAETPDLSALLVLRALRMFRFFKVIHLFPNFTSIMRNFGRALKDSASLFAGYMVILFLSSMISTELFADRAPEFFGDPLLSIASTFRLFTIEGWYEIPDTVCAGMVRPFSTLVYIYFIALLVLGGIVFMSLLNSVFVDAMVSDNNGEILNKLDEIKKELEELKNSK